MTGGSLTGRRALVTGASSGIGRAIALGLAGAGADLVLHHHGQPEAADEVARQIGGLGREARIVTGDFTAPGAAAALLDTLEGHPVDIFIANAAIERRGPWETLPAETVQAHVQANFLSLIALLQGLVPGMAARGWGRVVCLGSIMQARPRAETLAYAAMKSAQLTALRALAREVAAQGVTLNAVSPGAIRTERMADRYNDPAFVAAVTAKIPAARPGTPEDIVPPVLMLCSDGGGYITGADIPVDGGWGIGDAMSALPGPS
ncbi:SDR family NAD(P)-dependent oxidoreductase [Vannielia litorea]|uniref:NAD(P)-dependent dehydrogenase, short-chain alcohol dehydrogenase family n=1 Tax=Vannielia litorea TaxID=1217970 RepID=A0A1N6E2M9_9RHOB|nr:SDR family oxidoreductase [Vannielia litorea]SIN77233.1 NAD(P)-dependent dehydrogenase, short-chain alcohol dehydrogenase family [Vannielia litorea]